MKSIEERKQDFAAEIAPYVLKYGRKVANDFYKYWTQINPNGRKMLFEKERTKKCFQVSRRLSTWSQKNKRFAPKKQQNQIDWTQVS